MSAVRLLIGTRKGAFIAGSDEGREYWTISGPLFGGWAVYHMKGSPADPDRIYASQSSGWFGQVVQRSSDGGQTFETVGNNFTYDGPPGEHLYFDGSSKPFSFSRVWHLEPSPHHWDVFYAGVEDAALFRSEDGGMTWSELTGLRRHPSAAPAPEECAPTPFFSTSPTRPLPSRCWSPSRRLESSEAAIPAPRGAW